MSSRQDLHQPVESLCSFEYLVKFVVDKLANNKGTPLPHHFNFLWDASKHGLDLSHINEPKVGVIVEGSANVNERAVPRVQLLTESSKEIAVCV